jgi:hypothetical protein
VSENRYVIDAFGVVDIKRHSDTDRSFKFVSLDSKAAKKSGKDLSNPDGASGVIEARFYLEKEVKPVCIPSPYIPRKPYHPPIKPYDDTPWTKPYEPWVKPRPNYPRPGEIYCSSKNNSEYRNLNDINNGGIYNCSINSSTLRGRVSDGCTIKGNTTGQQFGTSYVDIENYYTSIKIYLKGYEGSTIPAVSVYCSNCGAKPHKNDKFCRVCGNKL